MYIFCLCLSFCWLSPVILFCQYFISFNLFSAIKFFSPIWFFLVHLKYPSSNLFSFSYSYFTPRLISQLWCGAPGDAASCRSMAMAPSRPQSPPKTLDDSLLCIASLSHSCFRLSAHCFPAFPLPFPFVFIYRLPPPPSPPLSSFSYISIICLNKIIRSHFKK